MMSLKASDPCPHGSVYGKCMNGECILLQVDGKIEGLAEFEAEQRRERLDSLRRGLSGGS